MTVMKEQLSMSITKEQLLMNHDKSTIPSERSRIIN